MPKSKSSFLGKYRMSKSYKKLKKLKKLEKNSSPLPPLRTLPEDTENSKIYGRDIQLRMRHKDTKEEGWLLASDFATSIFQTLEEYILEECERRLKEERKIRENDNKRRVRRWKF